MPHNRFFVDAPFEERASLAKEEARHLKVMRLQEGEQIELVNGRNQLATAQIIEIGKREVYLKILSLEKRDPPTPIILCQAIPRANRLDTIIEKGTELGMTHLWLFPGELSEKKQVNLTRARAITIAAMKQCGRLDLPEIELKPPLLKWDSLPYPAYFGDLSPNAPSFLKVLKKDTGICFFIGPESGFTEHEEAHLRHLGATGVKLHQNILRIDTAPLVALSMIQIELK